MKEPEEIDVEFSKSMDFEKCPGCPIMFEDVYRWNKFNRDKHIKGCNKKRKELASGKGSKRKIGTFETGSPKLTDIWSNILLI